MSPKDPIWNHFYSELNPKARLVAKCKLCTWKAVAVVDRMKQHYKTHSVQQTSQSIELPGKRLRTGMVRTSKHVSFVTSEDEKEALDRQVARYFYATNTPFAQASHPEFKKLVAMLRPGYNPPSKYRIGNKLLDQCYTKTLEECREPFKDKTVTMALDGWSDVHKEPIVGISIMDSDGNYAFANSVDTTGNPHTATYLLALAQKEIATCETQFKVRIGSFVTENTGNVKRMRRELTEGKDIVQYGCNAHIFNLLSNDLQIPKVQDDVIAITKYFRNNSLASAWYKTAGGSKLVLPSAVRWNTIHKSIDSFLKNRGILTQICDDQEGNGIDPGIASRVNDSELAANCKKFRKRMHPIAIALDRCQRDSTTIAVAVEIWARLQSDFRGQPEEVQEALQYRRSTALGPDHYLANMIDHRFRGIRLTLEEKNEAMDHLAEINPEFLPIITAHCAGANPFPSYLYHEAMRVTSPIDWWSQANLVRPGFDWETLRPQWLELCNQLLSASATTAWFERLFSTHGLVPSKVSNNLGNEKAVKLVFMYRCLNRGKFLKKTSLNFVWNYVDGDAEQDDLDVEYDEDGSSDQEDNNEVQMVQ